MAVKPGSVRLGLVGYGVGGRCFHAPFIEAAVGIELTGVVTRAPGARIAGPADGSRHREPRSLAYERYGRPFHD